MHLPFTAAIAFLAATAVASQAVESEDNAIFEPSYNQVARSFNSGLDFDLDYADSVDQRGRGGGRGGGLGSLLDLLEIFGGGDTIPAKRIQTNQRSGSNGRKAGGGKVGRASNRGGGLGGILELFELFNQPSEVKITPIRRELSDQRGGEYNDYEDYDYEDSYNQRGSRHRKGLKKWGTKFGNDLGDRLADTIAQARTNAAAYYNNQQPANNNQQPANNENGQYVEGSQENEEEDVQQVEDTQPQGGVQKRSPAPFVAPSKEWLRQHPDTARKYRNHQIMF